MFVFCVLFWGDLEFTQIFLCIFFSFVSPFFSYLECNCRILNYTDFSDVLK